MYSYWCGSKITYEFGWDYPGDYHGQDYGFSGAGNTKNPSIWLEPDWIFGGISSVLIKPYDDVKRGAVTLFDTADCSG